MIKQQLLIIDDEQDMLQGLQRVLGYEFQDVEVDVCSQSGQALGLLQDKGYDLVLLDIRMPEMDGLELLQRIKQLDPWITVIMMTAYGSIELAVQSIKQGAYDFISKPFEMQDLLRLLRKGLERSQLIRENLNLRRHISEQSGFGRLIGQSRPMQRLFESIRSIARSEYAVLIRGQSGTGKELVARAIHDLSKRGGRSLVTVNCPAIPESLLESELFGHKRGAFTGALQEQKGLFQEAHGSSLLLDEIADIPVSVQTKLLRVLQEQEIRPLGSNRHISVDVRILSTTNQDLEEKLKDKSFREDLFYRLNVVTVKTPRLEDIQEDIPLLVDFFIQQVCAELDMPPKPFSAPVMERLQNRSWPGNVRELQNVVRRAIIFCPGDEITLQDLDVGENNGRASQAEGGHIQAGTLEPYTQAKERVLQRFTTEYVHQLMQQTGGNISQAAKLAGISRVALQKILHRAGVDSQKYRRN
ncbi:MAG: sigma-54-dependent transcriptional regulator [Thermodesulfobacteriota bacterium]